MIRQRMIGRKRLRHPFQTFSLDRQTDGEFRGLDQRAESVSLIYNRLTDQFGHSLRLMRQHLLDQSGG